MSLRFGWQDQELVLLAYSCCSPRLAGGDPSLEVGAGSRWLKMNVRCAMLCAPRGNGAPVDSSLVVCCRVSAPGASLLTRWRPFGELLLASGGWVFSRDEGCRARFLIIFKLQLISFLSGKAAR